MTRIKLTKPGFETFTGNLLGVAFTNGISADADLGLIDRIAASQGGNIVDASGNFISVAGSAARKASISAPATVIATPDQVVPVGSAVTRVKSISSSTYTLVDGDLGLILDFTVGCTITVPVGLSANFNCALRQGGSSQITIVGANGVTVEEIDSKFKSEKRLALLTLLRFIDGKYQLLGRTAA